MFIENKYTRVYWRLISVARRRQLQERGEWHHVVPRSLGGGDSEENLVLLSYREHYLAHLLLTKMTTGPARRSMALALSFFNSQCSRCQRPLPRSRWYEYSRRVLREVRQGVAPSPQCQAAAAASRRGVRLSPAQRQQISASLRKSTAFFAVGPDDQQYSGPDLREFCIEHGLSFHTLIKRLSPGAQVLTAGRYRGWIYSSEPINNTHVAELRRQALEQAHARRSHAVAQQWTRERRESAGVQRARAVRLLDPHGHEHEFARLGDVQIYGPVSTIQLAVAGQKFKSGAWAGWTVL